MRHPHEKGTTVNRTERSTQKPSPTTGILTAFRGLLPVKGMGGPLVVVAIALLGVLLLAPVALAAGPPQFINTSLYPIEEELHSTRVAIEEELATEGLTTEWESEYSESKEGPWTASSSGKCESASGCIVSIGGPDPGAHTEESTNQLRHLKPGTPYFIRFIAKNADGEATETIPFETRPVEKPELAPYGAYIRARSHYRAIFVCGALSDNVGNCRAKIETNGAETKYNFEYSEQEGGPWKSFTSGATGTITAAEEYAVVEAQATSLTPEKTYYVRLTASNEKGEFIQTKYSTGIGSEESNSFETSTAKPFTGQLGVRNVTGEAVHIVGTVVPHGSETGWVFEYTTEPDNAGSWIAAPGGAGTVSQVQAEAIPYGTSIPVGSTLTGLSPSTVYYVREVAENKCATFCGSVTSNVVSFETSGFPNVLTFAAHGLHGEVSRLLGSVDPDSTPTSSEQTITLEGSPTGGTFTLTFKGQTTAPIPYNATPEKVHSALGALSSSSGLASVEGLVGGPYTVVFGNGVSEPPIEGDGLGLTPPGAVSVMTDVQGGEGYEASYHFEYVSQKQFETKGGFTKAASTAEVDVGFGNSPRAVGADVPTLQGGETYRYRIVAASTAPHTVPADGAEQSLTVPVSPPASATGAGSCPNEALRTGLSAHLPDCRAYEMLTPIDKEGAQEPFNYRLQIGGGLVVGEDGEHVALEPESVSWGSNPDSGGAPYFFSREEGRDWLLTAGSPQPETGVDRPIPQLYSADLTEMAFASVYETSAASQSQRVEYKVGPAGGPYKTVASIPREDDAEATASGWVAANGDFSKLVLQTEDHTLLNEGEPTGTSSGSDLYEYTPHGGLAQLNVDSEGSTIGTCGAIVAHGREDGDQHQVSGPHSVSADGSRVFFEAVPGKTCSNAKNLYMRVDGSETVDIGDYVFLAANAEGTRLLLEKQSGELHEIVLYETTDKTVTSLFTAHSNIGEAELNVSDDLTALYFVTSEQLSPGAPMVSGEGSDLYRYEIPAVGEPASALQFVEEITKWSGIGFSISITPEGRYAYFDAATVGGLPGGGSGGVADGNPLKKVAGVTGQVYRYDSVENVVECVSCASSFDPEPTTESTIDGVQGLPFLPGGTTAYSPVAADGDFVFFTTPAALVAQDVDGELEPENQLEHGVYSGGNGSGEYVQVGQTTTPSSDIYEWRKDGVDGCAQLRGCLALITDGRGGYLNLLLGSAEDGRDVFIYTRSKLLPQDDDTSGDIYDARINGGMPPAPARPTECEADACSTPPAPPNDATPSSLTSSGIGNVVTQATSPSSAKKKAVKKKAKKVKKRKVKREIRRSGKRASKSNERRGK